MYTHPYERNAQTLPMSTQLYEVVQVQFASCGDLAYQYEPWGSDSFILLKKNGPLGFWLLFHR